MRVNTYNDNDAGVCLYLIARSREEGRREQPPSLAMLEEEVVLSRE
jgi:hypothetical protein